MKKVSHAHVEAVFYGLTKDGLTTAADIAADLCLHKTTISAALAKLEQNGIVFRKRKSRNGAIVWAATGVPFVLQKTLSAIDPIPFETTIPMVDHPMLRWGIGRQENV